jgi:hypothetical protein
VLWAGVDWTGPGMLLVGEISCWHTKTRPQGDGGGVARAVRVNA